MLLLPLLLIPIAACHTWAYTDQPFSIMPERGPRHSLGDFRLQLASGETLELWQASLRHDSLVGQTRKPPREAAYAIADITGVEVRKADPVKTVWTVFGVTTVVFLVAATIAAATMGSISMGSSMERSAECRGRALPDPVFTDYPNRDLRGSPGSDRGRTRGPDRAARRSAAPGC
jgi:hypothetical protein